MRVQDVMTTAVHTVAPNTAAGEAWDHMRAAGVHHLVVQDDSGVVGVISDRDVGSRRGTTFRTGRTVGELMTRRVRTVAPTDTIRKAANAMRGRSIGCLVVVEGKRVVGIITTADLLALLGRGIERPAATTKRWTLRHRVPHRPQTGATGVW
jgi:CBS domain-containing protein